jgi:hypothetical protein
MEGKTIMTYIERIDLANTVEELEDLKKDIQEMINLNENYDSTHFDRYLDLVVRKEEELNDPEFEKKYAHLVEWYITEYKYEIKKLNTELQHAEKGYNKWIAKR